MLVFDLETNGLLNEVTCVHCLVIYDSESETTMVFNDQGSGVDSITRGVQLLEDADIIVGHNVIGYDIPVLEKIYPWFEPKALVIDTLLLSRLYFADQYNFDKKNQVERMPQQLYGRHSLESWGYRLKVYKGEYGKTADWSEWSEQMQDYCIQDVNVTCELCKHFHPYLNGSS